jgi:uncharacterized membrane protein YGL010W
MRDLFHRQLAAYAQYHRDPHNCATHFVGIPMLFLAVMLPLQALRVPVFHHEIPLSILLTVPAIAGWLALDLGVGAALSLLLCPLFVAAALIDRHGPVLMLGTTPCCLWSAGSSSFSVTACSKAASRPSWTICPTP